MDRPCAGCNSGDWAVPGTARADFKNARTAIQVALADTSDNGITIWPRERKGDLAVFEVSFVASVSPECKRYIVTIAKHGWLTTALPMDKCGSKLGAKQGK